MTDLVSFLRQSFKAAPSVGDDGQSVENKELAFGHVTFYGPSQLDTFFSSKYVRFDPRQLESNHVVLDLLFKHWHLSQPRLIISVTGGARRFIMHNKILYQFNRSLIRAATSADALIVTNGIWKGVTRLIGEAAQALRYQQGSTKASRVQLLGIAAWGILQETNSLVNNNFVSPLDMKRYRVYDNFENEKVPASLDPNHHAFLLVDNGTFRKYGEEIPFRNDLEDLILQHLGGGAEKTPGVLLVLEGGETTLTTTTEFLRKGRPAVVVDGLGGCGDLISYAYRISEGMTGEPNSACPDFVRFERIMLSECPHWKRYLHFKDSDAKSKAESKMHEANLLLFEDCVGKRDFVSIVKLTDAHLLDSAILEANFKASQRQSDPFQLLGLAIQWNRMDIASSYVFTGENMSNPTFFTNLNSHHELFLTAVKRNYYDSALTLIQHGFNLGGRYLTPTVLGEIYLNVLTPDGHETRFVDESLRTILNNLTSNSLDVVFGDYILEVMGDAISDLIRGHFPNIYSTLGYTVQSSRASRSAAVSAIRSIKKAMPAAARPPSGAANKQSNQGGEDGRRRTIFHMGPGETDLQKMPVSYPQRDLFIFCILLNRRQMAVLMWRQFGQGGALAGALFAAAVLRGLAARTGSMVELAESLQKHAEFWETTASNFIEHCFERGQATAQLLLIRAVPEFGNKTPFELAHAARLKKFMCTSCCYTKLNVNWRGHMSVTTPVSLIVGCTFFPLLLPAIKFRPGFDLGHESYFPTTTKVAAHMDPAVLETAAVEEQPTAPSSLRRVSIRASPSRIGFLQAVLMFYTAPVTKYITNACSYAIFLFIYSLFVLTQDLTSTAISWPEIVIWTWTVVMMLEESRQIILAHGGVRLRLKFFWSNQWHRIDLFAYTLFIAASICHIVAVCARIGYVEGGDSVTAMTSLDVAVMDLYNLALMFFFVRVLSYFYVSQVLGPKVIALIRMMLDVGFFIAIYVILLLAFSVPINALLYPGSPFRWELIKIVVYDFVLIIFQMNNPEPKVRGSQDGCIAYNASDPETYKENIKIAERCPQVNYLAVVLMCAYLIATSIVLLNLLIAMFSFTFNNVTTVSDAVWRFNMYEFVLSFHNKSSLAPPLSIVEHVISVIRFIVQKIEARRRANSDNNVDDDDGAANFRHNSPFVLYDELPPASSKKDSMLLRRKAYQMSMLVRFETSSIETFFEEDDAKTSGQAEHNDTP